MSVIRLIQIERKYKKPLEEVLKGLFRQGYGMQGAADKLCISSPTVKAVVDYCGLRDLVPPRGKLGHETRRIKKLRTVEGRV